MNRRNVTDYLDSVGHEGMRQGIKNRYSVKESKEKWNQGHDSRHKRKLNTERRRARKGS